MLYSADALVLSKHSRCRLVFVFHPSRRNLCPRCSLPLLAGQRKQIIAPGVDPLLASCSVLLKPSCGDYFRTYKPGDSLHIGITGIGSAVLSCDRGKLCVDREGWSGSIVVLRAEQLNISKERWNRVLYRLQNTHSWLHCKTDVYNCFDFLVTFLNTVAPSVFERRTKEDIVSEWIKRKVDALWSFCLLFRWCLYGNGVVMMADDMEDESSDDRLQDQSDFMRHQLHLFKHSYTTARVDAEQTSMQLGFEEGFDDYCQLARRLGKANGALEALRAARSSSLNMQRVEELHSSIQRCYAEMKNNLATLLPDENTDDVEPSEFNFEFARSCLSSFDAIDMELFGVDSLPENPGRSTVEVNRSAASRSETIQDLLERFRIMVECLVNATSHLLTSVNVDDSFLFS
ncbi:hypothetical protein M514_06048 [Trichuris suis]|uniref:MKRN2 opposite strand protein-like C-terminal domain-containing protein n=1 Tax=Trichuris suis TaxID=68888 RepID=A0A085NMM3_9BILA|nr:hypothetical protein M513_06048 [Trichuris suis]KFD70719.1 hypothetical protein M514_06048 [Trichuris suis]KHJ43782.1 hypothetical protein D918_06305 [Trichuris suis]